MFTKADIEKYFIAEKQSSLIFLIIGLVAIAVALFFLFNGKASFQKGAAMPLLIFGLLECGAGYVVYARSDRQRIENVYAYDMNPQKLQQEELPRMRKVNERLGILKWVEFAFLFAAVVMIFMFKSDEGKLFWYGFAITLALQVTLVLSADFIAANRAKLYQSQLETFVQASSPKY